MYPSDEGEEDTSDIDMCLKEKGTTLDEGQLKGLGTR